MGSFLRPEMHEVDKLKKANPADQKLQIRFDRFHSKFVNILFREHDSRAITFLYPR